MKPSMTETLTIGSRGTQWQIIAVTGAKSRTISMIKNRILFVKGVIFSPLLPD
jgi:hypothetical protein